MSKLIPYLLAIYPALHIGLGIFTKYMPDPGESKSWYSAIYHALVYFAIGNGNNGGPQGPIHT